MLWECEAEIDMDNRIIEEDIRDVWNEIDLSSLAGKSILLTGATGLIGTYLIYSLVEFNKRNSNQVQIHVIVHNGYPAHLEFLTENDIVTTHKGDLSDFVFCNSLPDCDYIIHAAGYGQPGKFMDKKIKTIRLNTMTTDVLLSKLKENGRFLFISTSEIYSGSDDIPYKESSCGATMPDHGRACYIEGKRCGEAICHAWEDMGKKARIARVALSYGPGVRSSDKRSLYNFIQKGLNGRIDLLDDGKAGRVYCYVADTVANLLNILLKGKETTYNVGGDSNITIRQLAELIGDVLQVPVYVPEEDNSLKEAPQVVSLDMEKVKNEFGKEKYISIEDGIRRTIQWYQANIH